MENYEMLGQVGQGSYGNVMKCRHRDSCCLVAIKKFIDSDDDQTVKKIALREIKLLRQLRHDNLVNLLEFWRHRRHWYLVFEFVERTLLDELEKNPFGLDVNSSRLYLFQILRAAAFCHQQHVIHRDIKPENILISRGDVVKLCDFGFARTVTSPAEGVSYTDYVATRWYRAPELLVGDTKYGRPVDVWALGCLTMEMLTGQPLFPGETDLDQIYQIVRCIGSLTTCHQELFHRNPVFSGMSLPEYSCRVPLQQQFPKIPNSTLVLVQKCLQMDPANRAECSEMLEDPFFTRDSFHIRVLKELNAKINRKQSENSTLPKIVSTPRPELSAVDVKIPRAKGKKQFKDTAGKNLTEIHIQSKDQEEAKTQKMSPSKHPKNIGITSEDPTPIKLFRGLSIKRVNNSVQGTIAIKNKSGNATCVELRKDNENCTSTKNCTTDSLETLKTHPEHRNAQSVLTQHMKAVSSHPVDCHSKQRNFRERNAFPLYSPVKESRQSSLSAPSEDLGRNTLNLKDPKVLKSDFLNVGTTSNMHLKVNIKASHAEEASRVPLEEHKEDFPVNTNCDTLKPVQADTHLQNSLRESCVNVTKHVIHVAKPTKASKQALHLNPEPSPDISNSGQAGTKKHTPAFSSIASSSFDSTALPTGRSQTYKATKETKHVSDKPLEDLLKDKQLTESSKHQQDCHHTSDTNDPHGCLKMCLLTSAAENESETSHFRRDYKNCSQCCRIHQCTTKKFKQSSIALPAKSQKAETCIRSVKQNETEPFEFLCQTTDSVPGMGSSIETKCEAPSNSSKSISPQKSRISINEKNNERVIEMANKIKTGNTLTAIGENRAAKQKFKKTELRSCRLSSLLYHSQLSSKTATPTISASISTTISRSGHLSQGFSLSPGHQRPRSMHGSVSLLVQKRCNTTGQLAPPNVHEAEGSRFRLCAYRKTTHEKRQQLQKRKPVTLPRRTNYKGNIS